jgi:hypothetical protein
MKRAYGMLAIGALAACLGACNAEDLSALSAAGVTPTIPEGGLTPEAIAASGLDQATQAKLTKGLAVIAQVRAKAAAVCGVVPVVESVANVFLAANATAQTVASVAKLTCTALGSTSYTSFARHSGDRVVGHLQINGWNVEVIGYRR